MFTIHAEGEVAMTFGEPAAIKFYRTGDVAISKTLLMKRKDLRFIERHDADWWRVFTALHARKSRVEYPKKAVTRFIRGR